MAQGLERLFWMLGGILILPFLIQLGITLSNTASAKEQATQLGSLSQAPQSRVVRISNEVVREQRRTFEL